MAECVSSVWESPELVQHQVTRSMLAHILLRLSTFAFSLAWRELLVGVTGVRTASLPK